MDGCTPQCKAMVMLVFGLVLILTSLYTSWNIWVVIGAMLIIKAIMLFLMPVCPCQKQAKGKK